MSETEQTGVSNFPLLKRSARTAGYTGVSLVFLQVTPVFMAGGFFGGLV